MTLSQNLTQGSKVISFDSYYSKLIKQKDDEILILKSEIYDLKAQLKIYQKPKKAYKTKQKTPTIQLDNFLNKHFERMMNTGKVDYYHIKNNLEKHLSSIEKQVFEFILQRTIKMKTGFNTISYTQFINGVTLGNEVYTEGIKADEKTIKKAIENLIEKKLILKHRFDNYHPYLYLLNVPKSIELYQELKDKKLTFNDCEQFNLLIRRKQKSFFDLNFKEDHKLLPEVGNIDGGGRNISYNGYDKFPPQVGKNPTSQNSKSIENSELQEKEKLPIVLPIVLNNSVPTVINDDDDFDKNDLVELIVNATCNGKKIDFNKKTAIDLIKTYPEVKGESIDIVIKNQLEWLPYRKEINKFPPAAILFNCIKENRGVPEEYEKTLKNKGLEESTKKYVPVLAIWDKNTVYNEVHESNAKMILNHKIFSEYINIQELSSGIDKLNSEINFLDKLKRTFDIITPEECFNSMSSKVMNLLNYFDERIYLLE